MPGVPELGGKVVCTQNCDLPRAYRASQLLIQPPPEQNSILNSANTYLLSTRYVREHPCLQSSGRDTASIPQTRWMFEVASQL